MNNLVGNNSTKNSFLTKVIFFVLPVLLGAGFFIFSRKVVVNALFAEQLAEVTKLDNISVYLKKDDAGFNQIVAMNFDNDEIISQTEESYTHANPQIDGTTVVWMSQVGGFWQIFMQNLMSKEIIQLTQLGNNVNPKINGLNIAWEGQVEGVWQIFLFDGIKTKQITAGNSAKQLSGIDGDHIIYQQKSEDDKGWNLYLYDLPSQQSLNLTPDVYIGNPNVYGNYVTWNKTDEKGKSEIYIYDIKSGVSTHDEIGNSEFVSSYKHKTQVSIQLAKENQPSVLKEPKKVTEADIKKELKLDGSGDSTDTDTNVKDKITNDGPSKNNNGTSDVTDTVIEKDTQNDLTIDTGQTGNSGGDLNTDTTSDIIEFTKQTSQSEN